MVLDQIRGWLEQDRSVKRVAEDLQLTSELILLVRMIFADGQMKPEELQQFKNLCKIVFDIPEEDVPDVLKYLQEFGYETNVADAAAMFETLDPERKRTLLLHLLSMAKADNEIHPGEIDLIRKTAEILSISAVDLQELQSRKSDGN